MGTSTDRQLAILRVYSAFTYPFACVPFLYFYYEDHGVTLPQYLTLISIYYATMIAAEIPTGFLADRLGRRIPVILGPIVLALSFATIATFETFVAFQLAQVAMGLGHSLLSGPPSAVLYEHLRRAGRADEFLRIESGFHGVRLAGTGISFLVGGVVAHLFGLRACIFLTVPLCLVAGVTGMLVREPRRKRTSSRRVPIVISATRDLRIPAVAWLVTYYIVLFCLLRYPFHLYQPFLSASGDDDPLYVGILFFALNIVAAPCSRLVPGLTRRFGERTMFWLLPLSLAASMWIMAGQFNHFGIAMFFIHQIPFGMHWSLIQEFANRRLRDASRTTVLSALSLFGRLAFAGFMGFTAIAVGDAEAGPATALVLRGAALGGFVALLASMFFGRRFLAGRA